eukprot:4932421-Lingulodinium_polyedra.AAC.1
MEAPRRHGLGYGILDPSGHVMERVATAEGWNSWCDRCGMYIGGVHVRCAVCDFDSCMECLALHR